MQETFTLIFVGALLLVGLIAFIVFVWSLIDCLRRDFKDQTEKIIWIIVILFGGFVGQIIYLTIGRKSGRITKTEKGKK